MLKLLQPAAFRTFLETLIPARRTRWIASVAIPWAEIGVSVLLVAPVKLVGPLAALVFSAGFAASALVATRRRGTSGCGCFGALDRSTPHWFTTVRSLVLVAGALTCVLLPVGNEWATATSKPLMLAVGALCGVGLATTSALLGQMLAFRETFVQLVTADQSSRELIGTHGQ